MMAVYCDTLGRRVLLPTDHIVRLEGNDGRLTVDYRCVCGAPGQLLTGRNRRGGGMSGHLGA